MLSLQKNEASPLSAHSHEYVEDIHGFMPKLVVQQGTAKRSASYEKITTPVTNFLIIIDVFAGAF